MAVKPWEQQDGEPQEAFVAFRVFLLMPREDRSIATAWRKYMRENQNNPVADTDNPSGGWYERATAWRWKERALAYDREEDRKLLTRLQNRRLQSLLETAELGSLLRKKAATAARMLSAVTQNIGTHEGREVVVMAVNLTPDQIVRMADVGTKIEQLALGNPTENVATVESPVEASLETARDMLKKKLAEIRRRRTEAEAGSEPDSETA